MLTNEKGELVNNGFFEEPIESQFLERASEEQNSSSVVLNVHEDSIPKETYKFTEEIESQSLHTKSTDCSVKNLLYTAIPVVISLLSSNIMHMINRTFLAHYSLTALNSVSLAQQLSNVVLWPLICFSMVSEVFVGQFNGAKNFRNTSLPIFQIIIFLIICWAIVCPFALYYCHLFISSTLYKYAAPYFAICIFMIPIQIIYGAISSFFIGTRQPKIILYSAIFGDVANSVLAYFFIFGIPGVIPSLGSTGAGIATLISLIISCSIILYFFLKHENSAIYETRNIRFDSNILKKNIALGTPSAISYTIEMGVWAIIASALAYTCIEEATMHNVCLTILYFSLFLVDGFQKGVMALASNCIGAEKESMINQLLISNLKVLICISALIAIPLLVFPSSILKFIFGITQFSMIAKIKEVFFALWINITFILMSSMCLGGILNAGGDNRFITYIRMSATIFCVAIPAFVFFRFGTYTALMSYVLGTMQQIIISILFFLRYKSGKWNRNLVK